MDSNIIIYINIFILIIAFLIKSVHDCYHRSNIKNKTHDKLEIINDALQQITNPNNGILSTKNNNEVINNVENIINKASDIEQKLLNNKK